MSSNPPTVEFVKDALRVARDAQKGAYEPSGYIVKFSPFMLIALMEDWLRLRETIDQVRVVAEMRGDVSTLVYLDARAALAKQG